jgi:ankyrin repeat protein
LKTGGLILTRGDEKGRTPLIIAAENGHVEIVKLLLKAGADVNIRDNEGRSAIIIAFNRDYTGIVQLLKKAGASKKIEGGGEWLSSAREGMVAWEDLPPLAKAAAEGDVEKMRELIANGADVDENIRYGITALMLSAELHNVDAVKVLLDAGADVNRQDNDVRETALIIASMNGYADIVKLLLKRGADMGKKREGGYTALMLAARNGHKEVVRILKEAGARK